MKFPAIFRAMKVMATSPGRGVFDCVGGPIIAFAPPMKWKSRAMVRRCLYLLSLISSDVSEGLVGEDNILRRGYILRRGCARGNGVKNGLLKGAPRETRGLGVRSRRQNAKAFDRRRDFSFVIVLKKVISSTRAKVE